MGFRINTNTAALAAHASATMNNRALDSSLSKLNSGFRITSAADDASGMAIADSLRSQANALGQAIMNANDAIGVIQTADKAMDEQIKILDTIKTKAIQAAQDTQTTETRRALQADINRLMEQLDNIGNTTSFNGQKLLSGNFSNKEFQIGAYSNETIKASIGPTTTDKIGLTRFETGHNIRLNDVMFAEGMEKTEDGEEGIMSDGKMTLTFKNVDGINDVTLEPVKFASFGKDENGNKTLDIKAGQGLGALVEAINKASDTTGIRASANVKSVFGHVISQGVTTENFRINGVTIGKIEVQSKDANGALRAAINRVKDQTGVEASVDSRGRLVLANRDGRGIKVEDGKLPQPSAAIGEAGKPKPTNPADNKPATDDKPIVGTANPATAPTTAAQANANAQMIKTPAAAAPKVPAGNAAVTELQTKSGKTLAVNAETGRMNVADLLSNRASNDTTPATFKAAIDATDFSSLASAKAQNVAVDRLIAGAGVSQNAAAHAVRTGRAENGESAPQFNNLDLSSFAFENNFDIDGKALFGAASDDVGNLGAIKSAKNLQDALDAVRAGKQQLDKNIAAMAQESTAKIGTDAASAVAAQALAVMMDRSAQLDGWQKAIEGVAQSWAQTVDAKTTVADAGVAVKVDAGKSSLAEKFTFQKSATDTTAATGIATAPQDGSKVSASTPVAGALTAADLPANHPANTGEEVGGTGGAGGDNTTSGSQQATPLGTKITTAAKEIAAASDLKGGRHGVQVDIKNTHKVASVNDNTVTGIADIVRPGVAAGDNNVTFDAINTALGDSDLGVYKLIKAQAKHAMLNAANTALGSTNTNGTLATKLTADVFNSNGTLKDLGKAIFEDGAYTQTTLTDTQLATLTGATTVAELADAINNLTVDAPASNTTKIGNSQEAADKFKADLGQAILKATVDGWKAAATDMKNFKQQSEFASPINTANEAVTSAKLTTKDSSGAINLTVPVFATDVEISTSPASKTNQVTGLATAETDGAFDKTNALSYANVSATLKQSGAFAHIEAAAAKQLADFLGTAGVVAEDGTLDLSKAFTEAQGKTPLGDLGAKMFTETGAYTTAFAADQKNAITGAKSLADLKTALGKMIASEGSGATKLPALTNADKNIGSPGTATKAEAAANLGIDAARAQITGWISAIDTISAAVEPKTTRSIDAPTTRGETAPAWTPSKANVTEVAGVTDYSTGAVNLSTLKTAFDTAISNANKTAPTNEQLDAISAAAQRLQAGIENAGADVVDKAKDAVVTTGGALNSAIGDVATAWTDAKTKAAAVISSSATPGSSTLQLGQIIEKAKNFADNLSKPDLQGAWTSWDDGASGATKEALANALTKLGGVGLSSISTTDDVLSAAKTIQEAATALENIGTQVKGGSSAVAATILGGALKSTYSVEGNSDAWDGFVQDIGKLAADAKNATGSTIKNLVDDLTALKAINDAISGTTVDVTKGNATLGKVDHSGAVTSAPTLTLLSDDQATRLFATPANYKIVKATEATDNISKAYTDHFAATGDLADASSELKTPSTSTAPAGNFSGMTTAKAKAEELTKLQKYVADELKKVSVDGTALTPAAVAAKPGAVGTLPSAQEPAAGQTGTDTGEAENAQGTGQTTTPAKKPVTPGDNSDKNLAANGNVPTLSEEVAKDPLGGNNTAAGVAAAHSELEAAVGKYTAAQDAGKLSNADRIELALAAQKVQLGIDKVVDGLKADAAKGVKTAQDSFSAAGEGKKIKDVADAAAQAVKDQLAGNATKGTQALKFKTAEASGTDVTLKDMVTAAKNFLTEAGITTRGASDLAANTELVAAMQKIAAIDVDSITADTLGATMQAISDAFSGEALKTTLSQVAAGSKDAVSSALGGSMTLEKFSYAAGQISGALANTNDGLGKVQSNGAAVGKLVDAVAAGDETNIENLLTSAKTAAQTGLGVDSTLTNAMPTTKAAVSAGLQTIAKAKAVVKAVTDLIDDPSKAKAGAGDSQLLKDLNAVLSQRNGLANLIAQTGLTLADLGAVAGKIGQPPVGGAAAMPEPLKVVTRDEGTYEDPASAADYASKKMPADWKAPETEGAERLTEGLADREEVAVNMAALTGAKELGGLVKAGSKADEIVDLRDLLDGTKNTGVNTDVDTLTGALKTAKVFDKITDTAAREMTQKLADAIGENIDGSLPEGVSLEFLQSIGGEWQHDNSLLEAANSATNLTDLRHELEKAREALNRDGIALSDAPENPFADEDAELYAALEDESAPTHAHRRALGDSAAVGKNATEDDVAIARQTLAKLDAIAQIDGWLGAIDEARLALDELAEEREDMGKSLADIIGLNTENSVNFGRLSLVGAGAKDIQLEITDAHGNDMTSAAGFDRDVHEKTVSLRETNAKTERDVAAAQGFNAEDWMDDDLGENANGYPAGVMTFKGAQAMIDIAETAQKALEAIRSDLGSVQNQLVVTVNNISVTQVNVKAAESNIRDVDFAQESATFSKHQILAQSGVYAMSQANAVQQNVMRLLQ